MFWNFLCTWVFCLHCVCILCECSADGGPEEALVLPWNWIYRGLWAIVWVLWIKPGSPARAVFLTAEPFFLALFVAFIRAREDVIDLTTSPKNLTKYEFMKLFGLLNIVTMTALSGPWLPGPGNSGHYHISLTAYSYKGFVGTQPGLFVCYSTTGVC